MGEKQLYSEDAERALLSAILISNQIDDLDLKPSDFYLQAHATIYKAMLELARAGEPIDNITLKEELSKANQYERVGGFSYLAELAGAAPDSTNAASYAEIVKDYARRREALELTSKLATAAYNANQDFDAAIADAQNAISALNENTNGNRGQRLATYADVLAEASATSWAWKGWLADGYLTMLVGGLGSGKSWLACRIAGCYAAGLDLPDGTPFTGKTGRVVWAEAEAFQKTNAQHMDAMGIPVDKIISPFTDAFIDLQLANPQHLNCLFSAAHLDDVRLIVIDSLSGADPTAEKSVEYAQNINLLAALARDVNKPILLTHHLRKQGMFDPDGEITLDRVRGSTAILQFARLVWALDVPDKTDKEHKRLSVIKSNLAKFPDPIGMRISDTGVSFDKAPEPPHVETLTDKGVDLLLSLLASEPMLATEVQAEFEGAGLSKKVMWNAKQALSIVSVRKDNKWYWSLPAKESE